MLNIDEIKTSILDSFSKVTDKSDLVQIKSRFVGKEGIVTKLFHDLKNESGESKQKLGQGINELKSLVLKMYSSTLQKLNESSYKQDAIDFSVPVNHQSGSLHPLTISTHRIHKIMQERGFVFESGPSIEDQYYNFDALNIDVDHPARNAQDTFFINDKVMRTHTTAVQIRALESGKHNGNFRIYSIGDVYRRDDDSTHLPMFHQIEGFIIDEHASIATLKHFLLDFLHEFFENPNISIRLRPGYFPFTEPSVEVDMKFNQLGKEGEWLEILGAGIIRKNILTKHGHTNGFAFGIGLERITMLKFGIKNIKDLVSNNYPWIKNYNKESL